MSKKVPASAPPLAHLPRHDESSAVVSASPEDVFALIDDHERLSSPMSQSSWRMGGGRMQTTLDAGRGQKVGSHIRVSGRVFGLELSLDEVVTERDPPNRKAWETVGSPRLLVIGPYRMRFEITRRESSSLLRVFIDYALPSSSPERPLRSERHPIPPDPSHELGERHRSGARRNVVSPRLASQRTLWALHA